MDRIQQLLSAFQNVSVSGVVLATDDLSSTARTLIPLKVGYTIYILRITMDVTTDNAATQTFQDNASTPIKVASTKASPGLGPIPSLDFGPDGFALTESKQLDLKNSAAGLAYSYNVTAYQKRTATAIIN